MSLPAAVALELVHNSSLVHDDIQDRATEQRHRPAVWSVWGMPQAITVGDGLLVLARSSLHFLRATKRYHGVSIRVKPQDEASPRLVAV